MRPRKPLPRIAIERLLGVPHSSNAEDSANGANRREPQDAGLKARRYKCMRERNPKRVRCFVPLQDGVNGGIDRNVRHLFLADDVALTLVAGKVQEPADVVILVEAREEVLGLLRAQPEREERHRVAETPGQRGIPFHDLAKVHHRRASSGTIHRTNSSGAKSPLIARYLMSELKLRPPKENANRIRGTAIPGCALVFGAATSLPRASVARRRPRRKMEIGGSKLAGRAAIR